MQNDWNLSGPIASWMTNKFGWRITTVIGEQNWACLKGKYFSKAQNGFQGAYWEQRGSAWVLSLQTFLFSSSPLEDFLVNPCLPLMFSWFWYHTVIMISKVMTTDQFYYFFSLILFWSKVLEFFLQVLVWASSICQGLTASPSTLTRRGPLSQVNTRSSLFFCQNIFS